MNTVASERTAQYLNRLNLKRLIDQRAERAFAVLRSTILPLTLICIAPEVAVSATTRLVDAAQQGARSEFARLLETGADVNQAQADGMTALHWAAHHDNAAMVRKLLAAGASATAANHYGVTPLLLACRNGSPSIVRLLLDAGADANAQLRGQESALMLAARTGQPKVVRMLLKLGAEIDHRDHKDQTALMWAAAEGHAAVVDILLNSGADFSERLESGFTPFTFAVRGGHQQVVERFISAGVDVNDGMRPKRAGNWNVRSRMSPLLLAVENGHFELAITLVDAGADPNDQRSGFTPLHNLAWVRKPNRGDGVSGTPPPRGSGSLTSLEFVRALVERGADVNAQLEKGQSGRAKMSHEGATPFLFAARRADLPMMKLLLELGADPTISNVDNCTPLMVAAGIGTLAPDEEAGTEEESLAAVGLLLKLGADINHVDDNQETAMHGAAYKSLPRMVDFLAEHGADVEIWNTKNRYGWTPTLIAEGHRVGNFKPSAETLAAVHRQLRAAGITPPPLTPREKKVGYDQQ